MLERVYPPVLTKRDFVKRYKAGEFGNASPTWDSITEWLESEWSSANSSQLFHLRNRIAGGPTWYNVPALSLPETWERICTTGQVKPQDLYISAMAPTEKTLSQGEIIRTEGGLQLIFSEVRKPMREALAEEYCLTQGIVAITRLRIDLNPLSMEWLEILWDRYPGHVIEYSAYSTCWGTLPGFNTVFWEVRKY